MSQISCGDQGQRNAKLLCQRVPENGSLSCPGAQARQIECGSEDPALNGHLILEMVTSERVFSHGVEGRTEAQ